MLDIVEHFLSLSGEAPISGMPTYFYRFTGCNLNCSFCDTLYKDEVNYQCSEDELIADIRKRCLNYPGLKILFTGGEPLLNNRKDILMRIVKRIPETDFYFETNGSVELPQVDFKNCHFVCDYKSLSSGEGDSFIEHNLERLEGGRDCIKFVVAEEDFDWLYERILYIKKQNNNLELFVSPVFGEIELDKLADFIIKNRLPVSLSLQMHKIIWPAAKRGV